MNMTNADFNKIEKALNLLPHGEQFLALPEDTQKTIIDAQVVLVRICRKKKASNEKTAKYIAEKRKKNKNYAR